MQWSLSICLVIESSGNFCSANNKDDVADLTMLLYYGHAAKVFEYYGEHEQNLDSLKKGLIAIASEFTAWFICSEHSEAQPQNDVVRVRTASKATKPLCYSNFWFLYAQHLHVLRTAWKLIF